MGEEMGEDLVRKLEAGESDAIAAAGTFAERLTVWDLDSAQITPTNIR